ncbi:MAG: hypothetical protein KDB86_02050, partial [Actinobacteria bacterium]|nr:hypothetical protein [Actinomycetota bacterium]
ALQPATEAVQLRRTLAEQNPAAHNPNLATTLIVMALRLAEADRSVEGVIAAREALQLVLPTAQRYPAAFQGLAMSIARDYVQLCQQAEAEPDLDLLRQAAAILTEG